MKLILIRVCSDIVFLSITNNIIRVNTIPLIVNRFIPLLIPSSEFSKDIKQQKRNPPTMAVNWEVQGPLAPLSLQHLAEKYKLTSQQI